MEMSLSRGTGWPTRVVDDGKGLVGGTAEEVTEGTRDVKELTEGMAEEVTERMRERRGATML